MILETAQMLSCAWWVLSPDQAKQKHDNGYIYKQAFKNHPCTRWARRSRSNYVWLSKLGLEMCKEYTHRYSRIHKTQKILQHLHDYIPPIEVLREKGMTRIPQAMPEECKRDSPIEAYRVLYQSDYKRHLACWKKRGKPEWYTKELDVTEESGSPMTKRMKH